MTAGKILAIDPGNVMSGYVIVEHDGKEIRKVIERGKIPNHEVLSVMDGFFSSDSSKALAIEMIQSYGMPVGQTVFDTCVWIGRFLERAGSLADDLEYRYIYRKDEKTNLCGTMKAKDANIRQALVDRYAEGATNSGKGTKKEPGFFYGFKADIWQAMAVAVTYFDLYSAKNKERGDGEL